jgi:hypothetical protein
MSSTNLSESALGSPSPSYFCLRPRLSVDPVCREIQFALSSFSFSDSLSKQPDSTATLAVPIRATADDGSIDPATIDLESHRPSVQRASSAPEASSSMSVLFLDSTTFRPMIPRGRSETLAAGLLERRRRKSAVHLSEGLPSQLVLNLADLPFTMGAGNIQLLRSARKALSEPKGFDWDPVLASPSSSLPTTALVDYRTRNTETSSPPLIPRPAIAPPRSGTASDYTLCEGPRRLSAWKTRFQQNIDKSGHHEDDEDEWDWALAGNARATHEALRFSRYKETRAPVHDIWQQLPDWVCRRSSVGGRDADTSLHGPSLHQSLSSSYPADTS